jgi:hypothetical protein
MPKISFSCGHKGKGAHCHRCEEATRLDAIAAGSAKPQKAESFKGRDKGWFRMEAQRLRTLSGKISDTSMKPFSLGDDATGKV